MSFAAALMGANKGITKGQDIQIAEMLRQLAAQQQEAKELRMLRAREESQGRLQHQQADFQDQRLADALRAQLDSDPMFRRVLRKTGVDPENATVQELQGSRFRADVKEGKKTKRQDRQYSERTTAVSTAVPGDTVEGILSRVPNFGDLKPREQDRLRGIAESTLKAANHKQANEEAQRAAYGRPPRTPGTPAQIEAAAALAGVALGIPEDQRGPLYEIVGTLLGTDGAEGMKFVYQQAIDIGQTRLGAGARTARSARPSDKARQEHATISENSALDLARSLLRKDRQGTSEGGIIAGMQLSEAYKNMGAREILPNLSPQAQQEFNRATKIIQGIIANSPPGPGGGVSMEGEQRVERFVNLVASGYSTQEALEIMRGSQ